MHSLKPKNLLSIQESLAVGLKKVGHYIMKCRSLGITQGYWEGTQYKALADIEANSRMCEELQQILDIQIISEEDITTHDHRRPDVYWLVDPIDGTASFAHGFDGFVSQAALILNEVPILAGVYAPALDKLFLAINGQGATLNGYPLAVHSPDYFPAAPVLVDNYPTPRGIAAFLYSRLNCSRYVESGSIGLKICLVAEGKADVFVKDVPVRDWDVAAPQLVLDEAGGIVTDFLGSSFQYRGSFHKRGLIATPNYNFHNYVRRVADKNLSSTSS